ncbi:MAG: hypothetical protein ACK5ZV_14815 [bacterium]
MDWTSSDAREAGGGNGTGGRRQMLVLQAAEGMPGRGPEDG